MKQHTFLELPTKELAIELERYRESLAQQIWDNDRKDLVKEWFNVYLALEYIYNCTDGLTVFFIE